MTGIELLHVPYRGSAPLMTDVLAGRIDMTFDSFTVYEEHIKSGRVRALGRDLQGSRRCAAGGAHHRRAGPRGYDVSNWLGVLAPAGTPPAVIKTHP